MPGPFPGMDPYLEHSTYFPAVHHSLIYLMTETLNTLLPPQYAANIGERVYLVHDARDVVPDILVIQPPILVPVGAGASRTEEMTESDSPWVLNVEPIEITEAYIEIAPAQDESQVITSIEILSPSNKASGTEGWRQYRRKQRRILQSDTHLIEIDLLREGAHTVAAPRAELFKKGRWDYLVCLHRAGQNGRYEIWPNTIRIPLPRFRVPLANDDPDVVLDLQAVFDRCYDGGPYRRRADYRKDPPTPLSPEDRAWADALLREKGLRS